MTTKDHIERKTMIGMTIMALCSAAPLVLGGGWWMLLWIVAAAAGASVVITLIDWDIRRQGF